MDPYSAHAIASTRSDELLREAEEYRAARTARESREDERPARPPRPVRARRWSVAG